MMSLNDLYESLKAFDADLAPVRELEKASLAIRNRLLEQVEALEPNFGIKSEHPLYGINNDLKRALKKITSDAASQWEQHQGMRELSDLYQDRTLLLVCGKVNAGKSSFINTVAGLFPELPVSAFQLQDGKIVAVEGAFREGNLETTCTIQWLEIGSRLVLMDSPGLHSVTPANSKLAQNFLDAADGILWLSSSISAGQVQELDVLVSELRTGKPVVPVITKSDQVENDVSENDPDTIVARLLPKSSKARESLANDVYRRAREHAHKAGIQAQLRHPVSLSIEYYREHAHEPDQVAASGLPDLYRELTWLVDQARSYKPGKAHKQMANHLDRQLLAPIHDALNKGMRQFQACINNEIRILESAKSSIRARVTEHMLALAPSLVEQHRQTRDTEGLKKALEQHLTTAISEQTSSHLTRCLDSLNGRLVEISQLDLEGFKPVTAQVRQLSGSAAKACWGAGLATIGLAAGFLGGPPAAVAGSMAGGIIGRAIGSTMVSETWITTDTGEVDASAVLRSATKSIAEAVSEQVNRVMNEIIHTLRASDRYLNAIQSTVSDSEKAIADLLNTVATKEHR